MTDTTEAVAKRDEQQAKIDALASGHFTPEQVALVKATVAKGASDDELRLFIRVCARTKLDPFTRQIHYVKRWDSRLEKEVGAIQTGIDGYRLIAQRSGEYDGQDAPEWFDAEENKWVDVWVRPEEEAPSAARIRVYRKGVDRPFVGIARWDGYVQRKKGGDPNAMWAKMGPEQLAKCAEAQALRKAFPQELSDLYTEEEMGQADTPPPAPSRRKYGIQAEGTKSVAEVIAEVLPDSDIGDDAPEDPDDEPGESTPLSHTDLLAICAKATRITKRTFAKEAPKGSGTMWFVDRDGIMATLRDGDQPRSVRVDADMDAGRLNLLYDYVSGVVEREQERTA